MYFIFNSKKKKTCFAFPAFPKIFADVAWIPIRMPKFVPRLLIPLEKYTILKNFELPHTESCA